MDECSMQLTSSQPPKPYRFSSFQNWKGPVFSVLFLILHHYCNRWDLVITRSFHRGSRTHNRLNLTGYWKLNREKWYFLIYKSADNIFKITLGLTQLLHELDCRPVITFCWMVTYTVLQHDNWKTKEKNKKTVNNPKIEKLMRLKALRVVRVWLRLYLITSRFRKSNSI